MIKLRGCPADSLFIWYLNMKLAYKLKKDELSSYYRKMLEDDDSVFKFRWRLRLMMPAGILVLTLIVNKGILSWLLTAVACIAWFLLADNVLYPKYEKRVINAYLQKTGELQNLNVEITDHCLKVNNAVFNPVSWVMLDDMFLIVSDKKTNLLLPKRVLDGRQVTEFETMIQKMIESGVKV